MRVIMLSTDRKLFEPNSAVAERMIEYGRVLGELQVVVFSKKEKIKKLSEQVTIYPTNSWFRLFYLFDALGLVLKLNRKKNSANSLEKVDWLSAQDPFETGLVAWVANIFIKTKLQLQLHTDVFSPFFARSSFLNQIRVVLAKFLLPRADRIRVVSQKIFDSLVLGVLNLPSDNITVLPVFVDIEEFRSREITLDLKQKYTQFEHIILMASRFEAEKDFGTAIRSFYQVFLKWPKAGLVIVGEGSKRDEIDRLVKKFGLKLNVIIEPWSLDLSSYFKTADVYLLTSLFEGYSRTLIESSIVGTPFVSTDVGCAQELLDLKMSGLVTPVQDWRAIYMALNSLLEEKTPKNREQVILPKSVHFLSKEKFLELYQKSFNF